MLCKLASVHQKYALVKNMREKQIDYKTDLSVLKCPYSNSNYYIQKRVLRLQQDSQVRICCDLKFRWVLVR